MDEVKKKLKLNLYLGDIIQIDSPLNPDLDNKTFYIKFINDKKILLVNEEKITTLSLDDDKTILEESINNITLLYRNELLGYVKQNNISLNSMLSIYFGGDFPFVINGVVTNIEEDMIELKIFVSNEVIYIDFGYKGIPEDLNIEKIIVKDKQHPQSIIDSKLESDIIEDDLEEGDTSEDFKKDREKDIGEEEDVDTNYLDLNNKDKLDSDLIYVETEDIVDEMIIDFAEDAEDVELYHTVNVSESERRYMLNEQCDDYIDKMLLKIDTISSIDEDYNNYINSEEFILKSINKELIRYKELRNLYSDFDEHNNPKMREIKNEFYKPLKETLIDFDEKLYWILPVSKIDTYLTLEKDSIDDAYYNEYNEEDKENIYSVADFIKKLNNVENKWSNNKYKEKFNSYREYILALLPLYDNTINFNIVDNIQSINNSNNSFETNTNNLDIIVEDNDDFFKNKITNNSIKETRFNFEVLNPGTTMLQSDVKNNKKYYKKIPLSSNDDFTISSFLTLPMPVYRFSRVNQKYTNIKERCNLNINFLNYFKLLNELSFVNKHILDETNYDKFIDTYENIHDNTIFSSINNFTIDDNIKTSFNNKYNNLLESFVPTTNSLLKLLASNNTYLNYTMFLNDLQMANIDLYNINNVDNELINKILIKNISIFRETLVKTEELFDNVSNILNRNLEKDNYIYNFTLLNKDIKNEVLETYNISEENIYNDTELINRFIEIDNAKFFMNAVNKNIMELIVSNLLDNFIKASKKSNQNKEPQQQQQQQEEDQEQQQQPQNEGEKVEEGVTTEEGEKVNQGLQVGGAEGDEDKDEDLDTKELRDIEMKENCDTYVLSKKYNNLEDLEYDNNKLIFFDSIYDNTYYSLKEKYDKENESMDSKQFTDFIVTRVQDIMNLSKEKSYREAVSIVADKREVIDDDYAILVDKKSNKNYIYVRKNNVWVLDDKFKDNFYIDSNKIFCNISRECLSFNNKCLSKDDKDKMVLKDDIDKILENFTLKYNLSVEEIKGKINKNFEIAKETLKKKIDINRKNEELINRLLISLNYNGTGLNSPSKDKSITSPYLNLREKIMGLADISKKYIYIKTFCLNFTRESIDDENVNWLYCNKTGMRLIPRFILRLANVFKNQLEYLREVDTICAEQGTISDDNSFWVDKHSGYIIKRIDFNENEESFDRTSNLQTKELSDVDLLLDKDVLLGKHNTNPDIDTIKLIIKAMTNMMGISVPDIDNIVINVLNIQKQVPPNSQKLAEKLKKDKNVSNYEDFYNTSLLLLTLTFLIVFIQTSIPNIRSKKTFPGCIKSFLGFPVLENEDKTSITYIACVANKIKSSVKPWNTILKMSENTLVKKIESLINKYVVTDKKLLELIVKKREYISENKEEYIPEEVSVNNWHNFLPPLMDLSIKDDLLLPLNASFKEEIVATYTKGTKNNYVDVIRSKIIYYSLNIVERIQNVVKKNSVLLENKDGQAFLENSCCNSLLNTINFFIKSDKIIYENNEYIKYCKELLYKAINLSNASILYDNSNTQNKLSKIVKDFNEIIIYKAVIYYCNFENNLSIDDELKRVCLDKPENFDNKLSIEENIELLKSQGKIYNRATLDDLLNIINKRNLIVNDTNKPLLNNQSYIKELIKNYKDTKYNIDDKLIESLDNTIDNFDITGKDKKDIDSLKNYMATVNVLMRESIIKNFNKYSKISKKEKDSFKNMINLNINVNDIEFYKTYIDNLLNIFPNIVLNRCINYSSIPDHWKLAGRHIMDIENILKRYYSELMLFKANPCIDIVFRRVKDKFLFIRKLINYIFYVKPVNVSTDFSIHSIFDEEFIIYFLNYCYLTITNEYLIIFNDTEFNLEIENNDECDKNILMENISNYLNIFFKIMTNHNKLLDNNYKKVKDKISQAKEKEKDTITDYLKSLTDEEREIENVFKNNKLEKWSKGLQKGLTQYVKSNYDEERYELEKQAINEHKLNKISGVTEMNKEIYLFDIQEEETVNQNIEDDEYDMKNIPNDDMTDEEDFDAQDEYQDEYDDDYD